MNAQRFALTAAAVALVAGAAAGVQQSTQPRNPAQQTQQQGAGQPGRSESAAQGVQPIPSDWAIGADVVDPNGERLGELDDLLIDAEAGRVNYALISRGGVLGVGGQLVAVPWGSFKWNSDNRTFTLPTTVQRLEQAPKIERDRIEELTSPGERRGAFGMVNVRDDRAADQQNSWGAKGRYQNLVSGGQQTSISGTVTNIDREEPLRGMTEGIIVTVTLAGQAPGQAQEQEREQVVHLGPAWFIDRQEVMLRLNDQVQIEGIQTDLDGRTIVVAKTLSSPYGTFRLRDEQNRPVWDASTGAGAGGQDQRRQQAQGQQQQNQPQVIATQQRVQGPQAQDQGVQPVGEDVLRRDAGNMLLLSKMTDQTVRTQGQEDLGEVESVVFDASSGKLAFVVVGVGGFLGIGETKTAIPWSAIQVEPDKRLMAVNIDRDAIGNAPRIESDDWAELRDRNFIDRVYGHFGQANPFAGQQQGQQQGAQPAQDRERSAQQPAAQQQNRYSQLFQSGQPTELAGTVRSTSQAQPAGLSQQIVTLVVEDQHGKTRTVHLAPRSFLQQSNFELEQNDRVTVQGRSATVEGEEVVIASQIQKNGKTLNLRGEDGSPRWMQEENR